MKNLKEISWNVTEPEYRADPAISYSTISFFEREGFRKLPDRDKDIDTQAIRYGSLVDCLMTEEHRLEEIFYISKHGRPSDAIAGIVSNIIEMTGGEHQTLMDVPKETAVAFLNKAQYFTNRSDESRLKTLYEYGSKFYEEQQKSLGKITISEDDLRMAKQNVSTLRSHPHTSKFFTKNPFKNIDHLYQLKFKIPHTRGELRCMFDLILVDHENKKITPCDLKTTGFDEDQFENSFIKWGYFIQAQLYTHILKTVIQNDDYYKDFTIEEYKFIVINRFNNTPIVWTFDNNHHDGDYIHSKSKKIIRGWKSIYEDLMFHIERGEYKYPKEAIENKGEIKIKTVTSAEVF